MFNRKVFFDVVRGTLFHGSMTQQQVDGMDAILTAWEDDPRSDNLRWLSYPLATTAHETGFTMWPICEYGKGQGMEYGVPDPETGQTYFGRGYIQTTWRENYARADKELGLTGDKSCEWHADNQLEPDIAAETMFQGMVEGWFRGDSKGRQTLERYFNTETGVDDSWTAREIINGDKTKVPSWSGGVNIGNLIKGYHIHFLAALEASFMTGPQPEPGDEVVTETTMTIKLSITAAGQAHVEVVEAELG